MEFDEIVPELDNETLFDPFLCDPSQFLSCDSSCLSFVSNVVTKDPEYELNVDEEQNPVATRLTSLRAHQRTSKKKGEVRKRTVSQGTLKCNFRAMTASSPSCYFLDNCVHPGKVLAVGFQISCFVEVTLYIHRIS